MNSPAQLRVGLIGCGNIGARGHAPSYAQIAEAELVAVCDVISDRAARLAEQTGARAYQDYRHLLDREDIDVLDLCVPTAQHAPLAVEALKAGKHVLCEKPIARTLEEADAIIATVRETGRKAMIGHVRRFDRRYLEVKEAVQRGDIGTPAYIRRAERQWLPFAADAWYWHTDAGGGVIIDIGVHIADMFRWLYEQNPVSVYAVGRQVRDVAKQANSFDHVFITYRFANGGVGLGEASWAHPPEFGGGFYASLDVVGSHGRVQYSDQDSNPMIEFDAKTGAKLPQFFRFMSTTEFAFRDEIQHFLDCVVKDQDPAISLEDARSALAMVLAAQQSADSGKPVSLRLD